MFPPIDTPYYPFTHPSKRKELSMREDAVIIRLSAYLIFYWGVLLCR